MKNTLLATLFLILPLCALAQTGKNIDQLPAASNLSSGDKIPIWQSGVTKAAPFSLWQTALVGKVTLLPDSFTWDDCTNNGRFVYIGPGGYFAIVVSVKTNVHVFNAGSGYLYLADPDENYTLEIGPGESVNFDSVDEGSGIFSFSENNRHTPSDPTKLPLAGGTITGSVSASGQPGDPAVGGTRQPTDLLTKRGADSLYAILNDAIEWQTFNSEGTTWVSGAGSGFSAEQYGGGRNCTASGVASARAVTRFTLYPQLVQDVAISAALQFYGENNPESVAFFQWGTHNGAPPGVEPQVLSASNLGHGFGVKSYGTLNSVKFYAANGTNYSEQVFSLTAEYARQHLFLFLCKNGTVEFWTRRISSNNRPWELSATLTTGPTAAPAIYNRPLCVGTVTTASNSAASGVYFYGARVRAINQNGIY